MILPVCLHSALAFAQNEELRDVRPPLDVPEVNWSLWIAIGIAVAAFGISFFALRRHMRKSKAAPELIPAERALMALQALHGKDYIGRGESKIYFIELADILRRFIEEQMEISAREMTTDEFLHSVGSDPRFLPEQLDVLQKFLNETDSIKFAKHVPNQDEARTSLQLVQRFIEQMSIT